MSECIEPTALQAMYAEVVAELRDANETIGKQEDRLMTLTERNYNLDLKVRALEAELQQTKCALAIERDYPSKLESPNSCFDSNTQVMVFWRNADPSVHRSVWSVMRDELHLSIDSSCEHMKRRGQKCSPYVDSGEWSYYREDGSLYVNVQCGSTSDYDCDGSLCRLSYVITPYENFILVQVNRGYNY